MFCRLPEVVSRAFPPLCGVEVVRAGRTYLGHLLVRTRALGRPRSMSPSRVEPEPPQRQDSSLTEAPAQPAPQRQDSSLTEASALTEGSARPDRRRSALVAGLSLPPPQLHRGASPAFMKWLLEELAGRDDAVNIDTISTHDLTMGATWSQKLHKKKGYGYGPPTTPACVRALTMEAETSVYSFITATVGNDGDTGAMSWKHEAAQPLRDKLARRFGADWLRKCFGEDEDEGEWWG